jgi:hypothetical protein
MPKINLSQPVTQNAQHFAFKEIVVLERQNLD